MKEPIPIQRRDRPWIGNYVTVLCGPFVMPPLDELREAVAALAARYPSSRLTWRIDPTKRYWLNDRSIESVVVEREWDDVVSVSGRIDELASDESLEPPLTLVRYPNHLGLKMAHAVGDGRQFLTVMAAALHTAYSGELVQWPVKPAGRFPLATAVLRTFGKRPGVIRQTFADRSAHQVPAGPQGEGKPWTPSRRSHQTVVARDKVDELFAWGSEFAPGASKFALQMTVVLRALHQVGLDISPNVGVVVDLRRYLGWRFIDGNFIAAVPMNLNWKMSPAEVSAYIKATNTSGRPLASQILTSLRLSGEMPAPTSVEEDGLPRVTFSNLSFAPEIDSLPFLPDVPIVYAGSVATEGPLGITILTGETSRAVVFGSTFHDNVVDPAAFAQAMDLVKADPVGLMSSAE